MTSAVWPPITRCFLLSTVNRRSTSGQGRNRTEYIDRSLGMSEQGGMKQQKLETSRSNEKLVEMHLERCRARRDDPRFKQDDIKIARCSSVNTI